MDERRKDLRVQDSFKISYKVISPPDGWGNATGMDISTGGISLPVNQGILPGVILSLQINFIDNSPTINATAEVIWVKETQRKELPYTIGIKFLNIQQHDRDRICYHTNKRTEEGKPSGVDWIK